MNQDHEQPVRALELVRRQLACAPDISALSRVKALQEELATVYNALAWARKDLADMKARQ